MEFCDVPEVELNVLHKMNQVPLVQVWTVWLKPVLSSREKNDIVGVTKDQRFSIWLFDVWVFSIFEGF